MLKGMERKLALISKQAWQSCIR